MKLKYKKFYLKIQKETKRKKKTETLSIPITYSGMKKMNDFKSVVHL